ncbi:MAG: TAXI family TRAP transporter solute-binding subunit [Cyclobacteriaceae bacterium]
MKYLAVALLVFTLFGSCSETKKKFSIIYSPDEPIGEIVKTMKEVIERELGHEVELIIGEGSLANLDSLTKGRADFTIVENYVPFRTGVKSLFPFYPQVFHIFYRSDSEVKTFDELVYGKKVYIGPEGSSSYRFMMDIFNFFQVDMTKFEVTPNVWENDVFCGFTDIVKAEDLALFEGYRLYSFDEVANYGKGSIAEGISLKYPGAQPFIIPVETYGSLTEKPVLTFESDAVLIAREDLSDEIVYDITKLIFRDKPEFTRISPLISIDLTENFDRKKLNFPLAEGSRVYLDRDEPTLLERYAELAGVAFSILIALTSGLVSFSKWRSQAKKDRVDVFYKELMDIKNELPKIATLKEAALQVNKIKQAQNKAFEMLMDEKLTADESFRIYMELSKETINDVKLKMKRINAQNLSKN